MDNFYVDIFSTKGLEYGLVIVFLVSLVLFWRTLHKPAASRAPGPMATATIPRVEWFALVNGLYYHQGHTWARPEGEDLVCIGIDDFAQRLLGKPNAVRLPAVGTPLEQGERGWKFHFGSRVIDLLTPVGGTVVAVNEELLSSPGLINDDPYGKGWILKVQTPRLLVNLRNLLRGHLASSWMEETVSLLRKRMTPEGVPVLQDGGVPLEGFARNISPDHWDELAREFLLTS